MDSHYLWKAVSYGRYAHAEAAAIAEASGIQVHESDDVSELRAQREQCRENNRGLLAMHASQVCALLLTAFLCRRLIEQFPPPQCHIYYTISSQGLSNKWNFSSILKYPKEALTCGVQMCHVQCSITSPF
jgi:hypothetical protein